MKDNANDRKDRWRSTLLCHLAPWFGIAFATPLFVALNNLNELAISMATIAGGGALVAIALTATTLFLAAIGGDRTRWWLNRVLVTVAIAAALQGNLVHGLFDYGAFNGATMDLRAEGWVFWAEWIGWLLLPLVLFLATLRLRTMPAWLPSLPVLSFLALLLPALLESHSGRDVDAADIDPEVFAFSTRGNLIHLLPDGFQGDVVREVLETNPDLAERFRGFTLYTNHVGLYQGTAPALYTMLIGAPYDLREGYSQRLVAPRFEDWSYPRMLAHHGYRLDYVPISPIVCLEEADSCHPRPFGDMKARALKREPSTDAMYSLRLIADLSLFRLSPMYLKEKIYDEGYWFLADTTLDGSSPWPDPVIREWTENMHLIDDRPVYKWHHFVGTHIPARCDRDCQLQRGLEHLREHYVDQAYCVLGDIAALLARLDEAGIYDQTAMVISGDHGHNIAPDDISGPPLNSSLYEGLQGSARPAFLIKERDSRAPLRYSDLPTSLVDIAPTALALVGIEAEQLSVFDLRTELPRKRLFSPYSISRLWNEAPVPHSVYEVDGPANDPGRWKVTDIRVYREIPGAYDPVNYSTARQFMLGAIFNKLEPEAVGSWVKGRQLAFLIDVPQVADNMTLELTLHLARGIEKQTFSVEVNGQKAGQSAPLHPGQDFWQDVSIPLRPDAVTAGRNFVSILFAEAYYSADDPDWRAAALVKTIRVSANEVSEPGD